MQINILLMRKLSMDELNRKSSQEFTQSKKFPVVAVLENVRSAYNVGSVFRTADAFLIEEVILIGYTAVPPHKEIAKTALGAEAVVAWKHFSNAIEAIHYLKEHDYLILGVEQTSDSVPLDQLDNFVKHKVAFVFGNEVSGVEQKTLELCDGLVEIPQFGTKHSLNISVAAGVILWEAIKNSPLFLKQS